MKATLNKSIKNILEAGGKVSFNVGKEKEKIELIWSNYHKVWGIMPMGERFPKEELDNAVNYFLKLLKE